MIRAAIIVTISLSFPSAAFAGNDGWDDYPGYVRDYYPAYNPPDAPGYYREEIVYVPERAVEYVPAQPRHYAPPPPPAAYDGYDRRSVQGLAGGLIGGVLGYEISGGDPLAAGIGALAGALIGNGMQ